MASSPTKPSNQGPSTQSALKDGPSSNDRPKTSPLTQQLPALPAPGVDVATARFKAGIGNFQTLIDELVSSVEREREELRRQQEQLENDRKLFEEESQRVQRLNDSEQVGGRMGLPGLYVCMHVCMHACRRKGRRRIVHGIISF